MNIANLRFRISLILKIVIGLSFPLQAFADRAKHEIHFQRITGFNARHGDFKGLDLGSLNSELVNKNLELMTQHSGFIDNRLASFISSLSNMEGDPFQKEDDLQGALLLAITSDIDFRDLFTKRFRIVRKSDSVTVVPGQDYYVLGNNFDSLTAFVKSHELVFDSTQTDLYDSGLYAGLMTTDGFGHRFFKDGTNRRPIRAMYDIFLCRKLESYKDTSLDPFYIGPDIDRSPGKNPHNFDDNCSGCHAAMDAQRGALAYLDYDNNSSRVYRQNSVLAKYNRNPKEFGGFTTVSDHWENPLVTREHQARFGWRGPVSGTGHLSFSKMIVDSEQFQRCMVSQLTKEFCELSKKDLNRASARAEIQELADQFRKDGYKMKTIIKKIVGSNICL